MWVLFKEILGFLGGAALVIPWLRDFLKRTGLAQFMAIRAGGSLKRTLDKIIAEDQSWLAAPKTLDLVLTVVGLLLVTVSFLIGAFLAWGEMSP
jgi:hypothetical protein